MATNVAAVANLMKGFTSDASTIAKQWDRLSPLPGGKRLFSKVLGMAAPYTGSIGAVVEDIRKGYSRVTLKDRRSVRNHLSSVHAIALANLVELTGNIALLYSCPPQTRMIVAGISLEYLKKARGTLTAECRSPIPETNAKQQYDVEVVVKDAGGDIVAKGILKSLLGPTRASTL